MKTLDDVPIGTIEPLGCMIPCKVKPDKCGTFAIIFESGKSLFFQVDTDIDAVVGDMALYEGEYYILDDYEAIAILTK